MQSEDRLVHFSTELIHGPSKHAQPALQKLYYDLSQTPAAYDNIDFSQPPVARFHSKRGGNAQSIALFLPDRIVLVEEWADIALSTFLDKVLEVARRAMAELGIRQFPVQTVTLRSTFALTHHDNARSFLLDHVCQQAARIEPFFKRPVAHGGLRFSLPATPEHPYTLNVIIESFKHSQNEVFVEVKGGFNGQQIDAETLHKATDNIRQCRQFIIDNAYPFLNQYDTPKEGLV